MPVEYTLVRQNRRTLGIYLRGGTVEVRAPKKLPQREIDAFVASKSRWLEKHLAAQNAPKITLTPEQIESYKARAREVIPARAAYFAEVMGVKPASVKITSAKTRWGSCSARGNLCFSWRLMLASEAAQDAVVVHELAHLKEMNHSARFYAIVRGVLPDYDERRRELRWISTKFAV